MADSALLPMSSEEFLAWKPGQALKWEFDGVRPVAMVGASAAHNTIQGNLVTSLNNRLRGRPCRPYGPDMRVPTGQGRYRYPDAVVTCVPLEPRDRDASEPVVIFEVLSGSTVTTDRTEKLVEYRGIPSLQRYVMLEQDQALATVITRTDTGWAIDVLREGDGLAMPEIGIEVPMSELYLDVGLPAAPT